MNKANSLSSIISIGLAFLALPSFAAPKLAVSIEIDAAAEEIAESFSIRQGEFALIELTNLKSGRYHCSLTTADTATIHYNFNHYNPSKVLQEPPQFATLRPMEIFAVGELDASLEPFERAGILIQLRSFDKSGFIEIPDLGLANTNTLGEDWVNFAFACHFNASEPVETLRIRMDGQEMIVTHPQELKAAEALPLSDAHQDIFDRLITRLLSLCQEERKDKPKIFDALINTYAWLTKLKRSQEISEQTFEEKISELELAYELSDDHGKLLKQADRKQLAYELKPLLEAIDAYYLDLQGLFQELNSSPTKELSEYLETILLDLSRSRSLIRQLSTRSSVDFTLEREDVLRTLLVERQSTFHKQHMAKLKGEAFSKQKGEAQDLSDFYLTTLETAIETLAKMVKPSKLHDTTKLLIQASPGLHAMLARAFSIDGDYGNDRDVSPEHENELFANYFSRRPSILPFGQLGGGYTFYYEYDEASAAAGASLPYLSFLGTGQVISPLVELSDDNGASTVCDNKRKRIKPKQKGKAARRGKRRAHKPPKGLPQSDDAACAAPSDELSSPGVAAEESSGTDNEDTTDYSIFMRRWTEAEREANRRAALGDSPADADACASASDDNGAADLAEDTNPLGLTGNPKKIYQDIMAARPGIRWGQVETLCDQLQIELVAPGRGGSHRKFIPKTRPHIRPIIVAIPHPTDTLGPNRVRQLADFLAQFIQKTGMGSSEA